MKKVVATLEKDREVVEMIFSIFKGKDGAKNLAMILNARTDQTHELYDKAFEKEAKRLKLSYDENALNT